MLAKCSISSSAPLILALSLLLAGALESRAEILVSDDFSFNGSGTGWQGGSVYGNGSLVTDGVIGFGDTGARRFDNPIDLSVLGRVYVAMDYAQLTPGDGTSWGGLTMYEPNNDEAFFFGNPWSGEPANYRLVSGGGVDLNSGTPISPTGRRLTTEITHYGSEIRFRLWDQGNTDLNAPTAEQTIDAAASSIDAPWAFLAFRADGATTNAVDNLVIATSPLDVNLSSSVLFQIDRATGQLSIDATSSQAEVIGYTLESTAGALVPDTWTSIAGNYDASAGGNESVDNSPWQVNASTTTILMESALTPEAIDGATLGGSTIDLGTAIARSPYDDVRATVLLKDGSSLEAIVQYSGVHQLGDISGDGVVDADDWSQFKANGTAVNSGMTLVDSYQRGDLDGDLDHDLYDFYLFQNAYDTANGIGAFRSMLTGESTVPEPGTVLMAATALIVAAGWRKGGQFCGLLLVVVFTIISTGAAKAEIFAEDTFSFEGSGSGWKTNDPWGIVTGGTANTEVGGNAVRALTAPLIPTLYDKVYIAMDYKAQNGMHWGGLSFFSEDGSVSGNLGDETLFFGKPSNYPTYGAALQNGGDLLPPADPGMGEPHLVVNGEFRRMILEIDFDDDATEPYDDTYSLWIDNFNQAAPQWSVTIDNSPIGQWAAIRFARGSNENQMEIDNLVVTDDPDVAFARPLELVVDTSTGMVQIRNDNQIDIALDSYSIQSAGNSLNVGSADGDYNSDGFVNLADYTVWRDNLGSPAGSLANDPTGEAIGTAQYDIWKGNFGASGGGEGGWTPLAEQDLPGFPAGAGDGLGWEMANDPTASSVTEYFLLGQSTISSGASVELGAAYSIASGSEDLVFTYQLAGEQRTGRVTYVTSGGLATAAVPEPGGVILLLAGLCLFGITYRAYHSAAN